MCVIGQGRPPKSNMLTNVSETSKRDGSDHDRFYTVAVSGSWFRNRGFYLRGKEVVHRSEQGQRVVALHTLQTSTGVDTQPVQ